MYASKYKRAPRKKYRRSAATRRKSGYKRRSGGLRRKITKYVRRVKRRNFRKRVKRIVAERKTLVTHAVHHTTDDEDSDDRDWDVAFDFQDGMYATAYRGKHERGTLHLPISACIPLFQQLLKPADVFFNIRDFQQLRLKDKVFLSGSTLRFVISAKIPFRYRVTCWEHTGDVEWHFNERSTDSERRDLGSVRKVYAPATGVLTPDFTGLTDELFNADGILGDQNYGDRLTLPRNYKSADKCHFDYSGVVQNFSTTDVLRLFPYKFYCPIRKSYDFKAFDETLAWRKHCVWTLQFGRIDETLDTELVTADNVSVQTYWSE